MKRYCRYMNELVATAQVNGMEAIFSIVVASEREGESRLEALREAKEDFAKVIKDLDFAIATEEQAAKQPPVKNGSTDLLGTILDIARAGAAPYLPKGER